MQLQVASRSFKAIIFKKGYRQMLSRFDLKDYRLQRELSLRDVARYCSVCHELIGQVERGVVRVTEHNHNEIIKGINAASQAKAYGTFEADKEKEKMEGKARLEQMNEMKGEKQTTKKPGRPSKNGAGKKSQG